MPYISGINWNINRTVLCIFYCYRNECISSSRSVDIKLLLRIENMRYSRKTFFVILHKYPGCTLRVFQFLVGDLFYFSIINAIAVIIIMLLIFTFSKISVINENMIWHGFYSLIILSIRKKNYLSKNYYISLKTGTTAIKYLTIQSQLFFFIINVDIVYVTAFNVCCVFYYMQEYYLFYSCDLQNT